MEASCTTIAVGGLYEDCSYHPCLCTYADAENIEGISLVDGSALEVAAWLTAVRRF
jgi:hypothetical protein